MRPVNLNLLSRHWANILVVSRGVMYFSLLLLPFPSLRMKAGRVLEVVWYQCSLGSSTTTTTASAAKCMPLLLLLGKAAAAVVANAVGGAAERLPTWQSGRDMQQGWKRRRGANATAEQQQLAEGEETERAVPAVGGKEGLIGRGKTIDCNRFPSSILTLLPFITR